jgi:Haem-binding domain
MRKATRWTVLNAAVLLVVIQLLPFGRDHTNPPVRKEPAWDAPETRELAVRACFDCHSNETVWPWYSHVAPISWLVWSDVVRGRKELNFSEWDRPQLEARESGSTVRKGLMPPWYYPWGEPQCHRAANADPRARRHRWPQVTGTGAGTKEVHA